MPVKSAGQVFAKMLEGYGVTHVFTVPAVFRRGMVALEDTNIVRVTVHHEVSGAYMADGYARASRKPGIVMGQAAGNANIAAGLRDAWLAGSPVIAISGGSPVGWRYRDVYQIVEDFGMFDPVTKFNARIEMADRLGDILRQAFRVATTGNPGPVHLEIPGRTGEGIDDEGSFEVVVEEQFGHYPAFRPEADAESIRRAVVALAHAERPLIVAGGGVVASGAQQELLRLAELLSIPVATTANGKELIRDDHPLSLGVVGTYGRWSSNKIIGEADLVFFVGSAAGGLATRGWRIVPSEAKIIHLDIDPNVIGKHYPVDVALFGDAKRTLGRLVDSIGSRRSRDAWTSRAQGLLSEWRAEAAPHRNSDAMPIRPERLCKEISDWLPTDAVVVSDTGYSAIWTATMIDLRHETQRYIRCAGTLGWGLPGAMGVKCALPDQPVVCFIGDGGLWYHIGELETAARAGINVIVVVNNNSCLQQIIRGFDSAYGGTASSKASEMWNFKETNFANIANEVGCVGFRVERPQDLRQALDQALTVNRPVVIDVVTDGNATPTWS